MECFASALASLESQILQSNLAAQCWCSLLTISLLKVHRSQSTKDVHG